MKFEDSYVVRIFRRGASRRSEELAGVVENAGTGRRAAFHDIEELWAALGRGRSGTRSAKPKTGGEDK